MRAMVLDAPRRKLRLEERAAPPAPGPREVLIRIHACGVCLFLRPDASLLRCSRFVGRPIAWP